MDLCRQFQVERLELFGSAAGANFDPNSSDTDSLVKFPAGYDFRPWMTHFQKFQQRLSELVERPVDLVLESALRNPWFRREADKTRTLIYDASQDTEVASGHA